MTPRTRLRAAPRLAQGPPEPAFRVLFVCIGNVCRSPLGERLLVSKLRGDGFEVSSAGVGALVGSPMDSESADLLQSYGGSAEGFHPVC